MLKLVLSHSCLERDEDGFGEQSHAIDPMSPEGKAETKPRKLRGVLVRFQKVFKTDLGYGTLTNHHHRRNEKKLDVPYSSRTTC